MRTMQDLTESETLICLSFAKLNGSPIHKNGALSFGGLNFIACNNVKQSDLFGRLAWQVITHIGWIKEHGGECVKINVAVNRDTFITKKERREILSSVYDFDCFERFLTAILEKGW